MSGLDFLAMLQAKGVLSAAQTDRLRRKVADPSKPISPERLAKYLVEKGELDRQQARTLLDEFRRGAGGGLMQLSEADVVEEVVDLGAMAFGDDAGGYGAVDSPLQPLVPLADASEGSEERKPLVPFQARKVLTNRWESKWMIIGPTLVVVLAMAAAFLYFVLVRRGAEKILDAADAHYKSQAYAEAIEEYTEFVYFYPDNPKVSLAKVRTGMGRIRIFSDSSQWEKALELLPEVLPTIENEEAFPAEGRPDLAAILPRIADGFVSEADRSPDVETKQRLLDLCGRAMVYVDNSNFIPTSIRRQIDGTLTKLKEDYARVERDILRERKLVDALARMTEAMGNRETIRAFEIRKELLREFPVLESEPRLVEASKQVATTEQQLVVADDAGVRATGADQGNDLPKITLATRVGGTLTDQAGEIHPVLIRGAVYMFDVTDGRVLWRRFVGYETRTQPIWVNQRGGDLLVADQRSHEVLRVEGRSGDVVWRTGIGEPFSPPVISGQTVLVATRSGRVVRLALDAAAEIEAGAQVDGVRLPQQLTTSPASDRSGQFLYQPGLQANLYVLEAGSTDQQLQCREVYYLGHRAGSIAVPPVLVQGLLFVVENSGIDYSTLHILKPTQRGTGLVPAQLPIRLRGEVLAATELYGPQTLMVMTDRGEIRLFRVDATAEGEEPVSTLAPFDRQTPAGTFSFFLAEKGKMWIGDEGLSTFQIQVQRGQLDRSGAYFGREQFIAPFGLYGNALVQTRIRSGSRLVTVSAVDAVTLEELWRTDLAAPLAGTPFVELDGTTVALTSQGDQYVIDQALIDAGVGFEPRRRGSSAEQDLVFETTVDFGGGRVLCFGPPEKQRVLGIDPAERVNTAPISDSDIPAGTLAFPPVRLGDRALAGSTQGPLFLLDPLRGRAQGTPFQPAVGPDSQVRWVRPAVLDERSFVIGDQAGNLYRVVREGNGLAKEDQAELGVSIVTPMAARDGFVYFGTVAGNTPGLTAVDASDLSQSRVHPLPARIDFGPRTVGLSVLAGTTDGTLHGLGRDGSPLWSIPLDGGFAVGALEHEGVLYVSLSSGLIVKCRPEDGTVLERTIVGEPLGGDPFVQGGQLIVPAFDGTLCVLPLR